MLSNFNFDSQNEAECMLHFNFLAFFVQEKGIRQLTAVLSRIAL